MRLPTPDRKRQSTPNIDVVRHAAEVLAHGGREGLEDAVGHGGATHADPPIGEVLEDAGGRGDIEPGIEDSDRRGSAMAGEEGR
eukprot:2116344-Alexandrium_andersonii.AAC.1